MLGGSYWKRSGSEGRRKAVSDSYTEALVA